MWVSSLKGSAILTHRGIIQDHILIQEHTSLHHLMSAVCGNYQGTIHLAQYLGAGGQEWDTVRRLKS